MSASILIEHDVAELLLQHESRLLQQAFYVTLINE
jgi:hypothetical protein